MSQTSIEIAPQSLHPASLWVGPQTGNDETSERKLSSSIQRDSIRRQPQEATDDAEHTTTPHSSDESHVATHKTKRSKAQIATVMACLCACVFVAALEVTIVSTALPTIASHFASDSGYTWIGTSYVLAHTASTPSWGKISDIWGRKPILLIANVIFFAGSLMCALVDDFKIFIAGRVIQGLGAAGLQTLVNICISDMFSQRDRGLYYGLTSVVWAVASGIGPVMGGAFTQVSWRWCFWVNLPVTGLVFLLLIFTLQLPSPKTLVWAGLKAIDWPGSFLIIGGSLMLLLGLYLGGVYEPWNSAPVICLIVFGVLTGVLFVLNEWKLAEYPVIPVQLFRSRSSSAAYGVCFFHAFVFMGVAYYLPLYFQAVLMSSPLKSGLYLLPFILSISVSSAATGIYIQLTGKYMPAVYVGMVTMTLGIGLFIDIGFDSNWGKIISYQILTGIGVGMNFEGPLLAVQAAVSTDDVATATAAMSFIRTVSTAISIVIGGVVFQNEMKRRKNILVERLGPELARAFDGATASANVDIIKDLPAEMQVVVRRAFFESLKSIWIMYVAFAGVGLILGFFIRAHHLSQEQQTAKLGISSKPQALDARESGIVLTSSRPNDGIELETAAGSNSVRSRRS